MAVEFARKKKEDVSVVSFSPRSRPQRYFGSGSAIGNTNRFSTIDNYQPPPQAPLPIYYAQQNYQPSPQNYQPSPPIYQNQPPTYQKTPPNHQANVPAYQSPGQNNPNNNNLPRPNLETNPPRVFAPLS
ncbi:uncharacterized protein [Solanum lycopersicum]|uniref:uncharacterized protein n=1 Tax=Solanum lycopersicum TaxID=4081 RepID=UPI00374970C2